MSNLNASTSLSLHAALDLDPGETQEWLSSLEQTIEAHGAVRGQFLINALLEHTQRLGLGTAARFKDALTPHVNTVKVEEQGMFPGDLAIEERLASLMRWNALAMVVRANGAYGELGGHIASYASAADLFEVGFNHFFRARSSKQLEDLVFFQPHSAPGVYARAFLEGRLSENDLAHYRQEITADSAGAKGLSS